MINTHQIISYAQIASSVIVIILIALQQRGTALGSAFGGGGEFYSSRRGIQKNIYYATIAMVALFIVLSVVSLII